MKRPLRLALYALSSVTLAACTPAPQYFYHLESVALQSTQNPVFAYSIEIVSVTVPDVVDRSQIVIQHPDHQISLYETHRWISPLRFEITSALVQNLSLRLPEARIAARPQSVITHPHFRINVNFDRIDVYAGGMADFNALWSITDVKDGQRVEGRSTYNATAPTQTDFSAYATIYSQAVAHIANDITAALHRQSQP